MNNCNQNALSLSILEGYQKGFQLSDPEHTYQLLIHKDGSSVFLSDPDSIDLRKVFCSLDFRGLGFINNSLMINSSSEPKNLPQAQENEMIKVTQRIQYGDFHLAEPPVPDPRIRIIDEECFDIINLEYNLSPVTLWWQDYASFRENGLGFCTIDEGRIVSTCFTAFRSRKFAELSIQTLPGYRKKGFAYNLCLHFIQEVLRRGMTVEWTTDIWNTASQNLAQKLGFSNPSNFFILNYYRIPESIDFDPEVDRKIVGIYEFPDGDTFEITQDIGSNHEYFARFGDEKTRTPLFKEKENHYFVKTLDVNYKIEGNKLYLYQLNSAIIAEKKV